MSISITNEQTSYSRQRIAIYDFLIVALKEPLSQDTLQTLENEISPEFKVILTEGNQDLQQFFKELNNKNITEVAQREKEVFHSIFNVLNESGKIPAPPWESVYVTRDKSMFGDPVFQLREKLHEFGLQYKNENKEPEDHISIELEFMSFLVEYSMNAFEARNEDNFLKGVFNQYWLLDNHLIQWIHPFTKDILSSSNSSFYNGIATLLVNFLEEEMEYIRDLKEDLNND